MGKTTAPPCPPGGTAATEADPRGCFRPCRRPRGAVGTPAGLSPTLATPIPPLLPLLLPPLLPATAPSPDPMAPPDGDASPDPDKVDVLTTTVNWRRVARAARALLASPTRTRHASTLNNMLRHTESSNLAPVPASASGRWARPAKGTDPAPVPVPLPLPLPPCAASKSLVAEGAPAAASGAERTVAPPPRTPGRPEAGADLRAASKIRGQAVSSAWGACRAHATPNRTKVPSLGRTPTLAALPTMEPARVTLEDNGVTEEGGVPWEPGAGAAGAGENHPSVTASCSSL